LSTLVRRASASPATELVGLSSLEEISKRQRVKVWYEVEKERNRAVKLEKLPELGC